MGTEYRQERDQIAFAYRHQAIPCGDGFDESVIVVEPPVQVVELREINGLTFVRMDRIVAYVCKVNGCYAPASERGVVIPLADPHISVTAFLCERHAVICMMEWSQ